MTRRYLLLRLSAMALALVGFMAAGRSAHAADPATDFIQDLGGKAITVLADKAMADADREARFREIFLSAFDVPAIGQFVLGRYRRSATPDQLTEFDRLYTDDVVKTYSRRLSQYKGEQLKALGSQVQGDETVVRSQIISPNGGKPVSIDWRLTGTAGSYKIVDVVIENLSMRNAQREDYGSVVSAGGMDALLTGLRRKVGTSS